MNKKELFQAGTFFMIPLLFAFCVVLLSGSHPPEAMARVDNFDFDEDTLSTSSSLDTAIFDIGVLNSPRAYTLQIAADSVSGATGATCYLQIAVDQGTTDWTNLETIPIDGVSTISYDSGNFLRGRLRCACYAPSSTQVTVIRPNFVATQPTLTSSY